MTEINNRIEEVKKILNSIEPKEDNPDIQVVWDGIVDNMARQICQLFHQPLDDKELREKNIKAEIVNAYHTWRKHCEKLDHPKRIKEFMHRELYEQTASYFADQILALLQPKIEEAWSKGYGQASLNYTSKGEKQRIEEARKEGSSVAISEAYFRGRADGLAILEANVTSK